MTDACFSRVCDTNRIMSMDKNLYDQHGIQRTPTLTALPHIIPRYHLICFIHWYMLCALHFNILSINHTSIYLLSILYTLKNINGKINK